jgi:ATP-binding cassette subfamily F protein 3
MIHVEGLCKRYGDQVLLQDASWHVKKRDRIGLAGPNGSGKTTLLRMLAGLEAPDAGAIRMASDTTIGYLPQDGIVHAGRTVYDEVVLAFQELLALKDEQHRIEDALAHATADDDAHEKQLLRYAEVTERFKQLGGYEMEARIAEVLKGLGFSLQDQQRPTEQFSGGWQMRIALAKLLLARPNLLLMDEPTNHLDLPARNWLEEYLSDYPGSVILVSHDRYFLDTTVKRITQLGLKTLTDYHGNYSSYLVEHAARMERLLEAHRRQEEEVAKATAFINKFRYQATKARQVQSRIKMLEKVNRIEIPPQRKQIHFKFPEAARPGRVVLELKEVRRAYGELVVLDRVDLLVERGDRLAIVGPNGAGKSTLMRVLSGIDRPDDGIRLEGHKVSSQYFAQNQADVLSPGRTVYDEICSGSPLSMVPMLRNILGGFLFSGDDVHKPVSVLSGGERNRLALAKMLLIPSNLLLLDEPTNHLDLDSKQVLLDALSDYGGTLLFVSHDRYFVDRLATKVIEVGEGQILPYPGGYEDFLYWKAQRAQGTPPATSAGPAARAEAASSATPPPEAAQQTGRPNARTRKAERKRKKPPSPTYDPMAPRLRPAQASRSRQTLEREARRRRQRIADLEQRIAEKEAAVKGLEARMASPGFYQNHTEADQVVSDHQSLMWEVGSLMSQWEALQEEAD